MSLGGRYLRALPVQICMGGEHGEPKSVVRAAIEHKKRAAHSPQDRWTEYDQVWCVIDVEAPTPHSSLSDALRLAERHGIEVALTNPCFELWILLHSRRCRATRPRMPRRGRWRDSGPVAVPPVVSI
ncbi:MAG TPA: hypothetical protein DD420_14035 [Streptomyces sp.]|nr:hypothetical protein [Streptomyces sp.]